MKRNRIYISEYPDAHFLVDHEDKLMQMIAILESSFDGIYITDGNGVTLWINHSYEVISGLSGNDVIGHSMKELEQNNIISRSGTLLALEHKKTVTIGQTFKTGKRVLITSTPIFDNEDNIVIVVTNVRDISELYFLKEELAINKGIAERHLAEIELIRRHLGAESDLIANDPKMLELLRVASRVAKLDTVVLLLGETGVGKERLANFIHRHSERSKNSIIKVNCGAIAESLAESELFGYERGAFTGANREGKPGLFEVADRGTILLDEVGELSPAMQTKLLRVLQEQAIVRIGGRTPIKIDVRVLAATNRDLKALVAEGKFREDLYYRLSVFPLVIPPLRERKEDIPVLANSILDELNKKYSKQNTLTQAAVGVLLDYPWPGNVRELRNVMEHAFIMSDDSEILPSNLPIFLQRPLLGTEGQNSFDLKQHMERIEAEYILRALEKQPTVRAAARSLNMDAATFLRKRKKIEKQFPGIGQTDS